MANNNQQYIDHAPTDGRPKLGSHHHTLGSHTFRARADEPDTRCLPDLSSLGIHPSQRHGIGPYQNSGSARPPESSVQRHHGPPYVAPHTNPPSPRPQRQPVQQPQGQPAHQAPADHANQQPAQRRPRLLPAT